MKNITTLFAIICLSVLFLIPTKSQSQKIFRTGYNSHFYLSGSYLNTYETNHVTASDGYYSEGNFGRKYFKSDLGFQFSEIFAIEFGYTRRSLWVTKDLSHEGLRISQGGFSMSRINYLSAKLVHSLKLTNKFNIKTGLGWSIGNTNGNVRTLQGSETTTKNGLLEYTETPTIQFLHTGISHFLVTNIGAEFNVNKRIGLFINGIMYHGRTALVQEDIEYAIGEDSGTLSNTVYGGFKALEIGATFRFN